MSSTTTIYICTTCRLASEPPEPREQRAGAQLYRAVSKAATAEADLRVCPVECLSVCKRPVTVAFASASKWTYVYGDFALDNVDLLLDCARRFTTSGDGLVPWRERPDAMKRGVVARLPPR